MYKLITIFIVLFTFFDCQGFDNIKELVDREIIDTLVYNKVQGKKFLFFTSNHHSMRWSLIVPEEKGYEIFSGFKPHGRIRLKTVNRDTGIVTDTVVNKCPLINWGWRNGKKRWMI